jgi:hypothetical protein
LGRRKRVGGEGLEERGEERRRGEETSETCKMAGLLLLG